MVNASCRDCRNKNKVAGTHIPCVEFIAAKGAHPILNALMRLQKECYSYKTTMQLVRNMGELRKE